MKKIHKWIGIIISLVVILMSASGILLNHPELINKISVHKSLVPQHYHLSNWNRSTLKGNLNLDTSVYIYGRQGIFLTNSSGSDFTEVSVNGYPESARLKRTNDLKAYISDKDTMLIAACNGGLFQSSISYISWSQIELPSSAPIIKIIPNNDGIYVFSDSDAFLYSPKNGNISKQNLNRNHKTETMPLVEFVFMLHDGRAWGIPGKILFDVAGLVLIFLAISGLYIWLKPKSMKKQKSKKSTKTLKWNFRKHLKLGFWFVLPILIISSTGIFMRPPLIILLSGEVPVSLFPGFLSENIWNHKIRNVFWDSQRDVFVIDAKDSYFTGDFRDGFDKALPPIPIFPMGATVFTEENGKYIIGSFLGLFECDLESGRVVDLVAKETANIENPFMPGKNMITGMALMPSGERLIATHDIGLINSETFAMPKSIAENYQMPLWNYMFELHNGRLFKSMIGGSYILLVPLSGILLLMVTLSGLYRYLKKKAFKSKKSRKKQVTLTP